MAAHAIREVRRAARGGLLLGERGRLRVRRARERRRARGEPRGLARQSSHVRSSRPPRRPTSRQQPTPEIAVGRGAAVDLDVDTAAPQRFGLLGRELELGGKRAALRLRDREVGDRGPADAGRYTAVQLRDGRGAVQAAERAALLGVIESCHGNMTRVAGQLGMSRNTLYRRMKRHGIPLAHGV